MYLTLERDKTAIAKCRKDKLEYRAYKTRQELVEALNENDTVILSSMYSMSGKRINIIESLRVMLDKNVRFIALDIPITVKNVCRGRAFEIIIETVESILEYERSVHSGRPRRMDWDEFCSIYEKVLNNDISVAEMLKETGLPIGTYYRYKKIYEKEHGIGGDYE